MIHLLALALATGPEGSHEFNERVVLDTTTIDGNQVSLVIGPCEAQACVVSAQAKGTAPVELNRFSRRPYSVSLMDDGSWLVSVENDAFSVAWAPVKGIASVPTVMVHMEVGYEHVSDRWMLVTIESTPRALWSGGGMPRYAGPSRVTVADIDGKKVVIITLVVRSETSELPFDDVRVGVLRGAGDEALVLVEDARLYAVVSGTYPTPEEATAAKLNTTCLSPSWVLSTDEYPLLTKGLAMVARVTPLRLEADAWLADAQKCRSDAYIKRAR